jgi:hypothetical protein
MVKSKFNELVKAKAPLVCIEGYVYALDKKVLVAKYGLDITKDNDETDVQKVGSQIILGKLDINDYKVPITRMGKINKEAGVV